MNATLYGAIEAGGTKFVCAAGRGPHDLVETLRLPTTTPDETLGGAIAFFQQVEREHGALAAIGIASFGPIDCRPQSAQFGYITSTPKQGWGQTDFVGRVKASFKVPIAFDTDVNGAALAEYRWGAASDVNSCLYVTVGTGIGGGFVHHDRTLIGLLHPEMGHVPVVRHAEDSFEGHCPYHKHRCLEGMASGPAIEKRWGRRADELPSDHPAWTLQSDYLAQAVATWVLTLSPERVILGGGVMQQTHLFPRIRRRVREILNGFLQVSAILDEPDDYIGAPGLGERSGIVGALAMAMDLTP